MINLGKYAEDKQFRKVQQEDAKHIFKVDVNLYNKRHSEWYSIKSSDVKIARNMGLLNKNENGYIQYLDWKPLGGATNIKMSFIYMLILMKKYIVYLYT